MDASSTAMNQTASQEPENETVLGEVIRSWKKAELHLHLEGTLEPDLMLTFADRNGLPPPFSSEEEAHAAYQFRQLRDFLDLYYAATQTLQTEQDFYDLTTAYLARAHDDGVTHVEPFFDPQSHTSRHVPLATVIAGISGALDDGQRRWGITSRLIMCFLRDLGPQAAMHTLHEARPFLRHIAGVGLDSNEVGYPPAPFSPVYEQAREWGLRGVAHAGEEGPADYVWQCLHHLQVDRIDHGVRVGDDPRLMETLAERQIPLTMCPLSNRRLQVIPDLRAHPVREYLQAGILVTINSDDPAYFGGYVVDNYLAIADALHLSQDELARLADNSLRASWLD